VRHDRELRRRRGEQGIAVGLARATSSAAIAPLAPGRFSAMTDCPSRCVSQSAVMRASESVTPPGGNGTMTLIGFCGQVWA